MLRVHTKVRGIHIIYLCHACPRKKRNAFLGERSLKSHTSCSILLLPISRKTRVEQALNADTDRLYAESAVYQDAMRDDEARVRAWKQAMQRAYGDEVLSSSSCDERDLDVARATEEAYRSEITSLDQACASHRAELVQLLSLQREYALIRVQLEQENESAAHEQIALELEARAFDNEQEMLTRTLSVLNNEAERLSSMDVVRLHSALIRLQVDNERGLRYPLINDLRLAYRPKGDLQWKEIQAAWALAAQLLLMIGTLFEIQSQHWKIVPLSHCAKLIYRPPQQRGDDKTEVRTIVFNLGHHNTNGSKALLTWNALMCQVIQHVTSKIAHAKENGISLNETGTPPFEMSPTSIGSISLTKLDEKEDSGWSRVIHYTASNLLWLSNCCASAYALEQVLLASSLTGESVEDADAGRK
jgi:Apg6 BARA domain